ncbi:transcriptional regulator [Zobellella denitrificans]|uniref:Transcriptional regulator n=1 Tax=Zobellella denitrificans TaxID=347534 RepID=A0A291HKC7_9GAMM|nr:substrate-binding domain-containing protein [Zobellella denitrificans]ATG72562.1 transcriptional regulator [Zobellella denitrificans]
MATIKDVAAQAGVSISTVSHVLNRTRKVSEAARTRVEQAVRELNYAPNSVARSLKVNNTRTIGMLVTTSAHPFFAEVVQAVEDLCFELGYSLILCNTENQPERQLMHLRMLLEKRVDGLLVICTDTPPSLTELLQQHPSLPLVMLDWSRDNDFADIIHDNADIGGYLAAKYLIEQGHRDFACITGHLHKGTSRLRLEGFTRALAEAGLELPPEQIIEGDFESESGYRAIQQLLRQGSSATAVFAFCDTMAFGAICAITQAGLRVPQDISVIGYDDVNMARFTSPPLTTISHPKRTLGRWALELLLKRIKEKDHRPEQLELQPRLVVRDSVCPPGSRD